MDKLVLKDLVKQMRSLGVVYWKEGEVEIQLSPDAPQKSKRIRRTREQIAADDAAKQAIERAISLEPAKTLPQDSEELIAQALTKPAWMDYTEEELLSWSSGGHIQPDEDSP
jgi:hypothetical protein